MRTMQMTYRRKPMNRTNSENKLISKSAEEIEGSVFKNDQKEHMLHREEVKEVKLSKLYNEKYKGLVETYESRIATKDIGGDMNNHDIYIISNIFGGGSLRYKNDIKIMYPNVTIHEITCKQDMHEYNYGPNSVIFLQQLLFMDITPDDIINLKKRSGCKLCICVHDYCWLNEYLDNTQNLKQYNWSYLKEHNVPDIIKRLFFSAELIICPSIFVLNEYKKKIGGCNFVHVPHIDYKLNMNSLFTNIITKRTIRIGVMTEFSEYKGETLIRSIMDNITEYRGYTIEYCVVGHNIPKYLEEDYDNFVSKYNFHGLFVLNKWAETYCYTLTKILNSGLPIYYSNIGAVGERVMKKPHHFIANNSEQEYDYICKNPHVTLYPFFEYIIKNQGTYVMRSLNTKLYTNTFYDLIFGDKTRYDYSEIHKVVLPFAIYFPQFHKLMENDNNYYNNMTDITNLISYLLQKNKTDESLSPSKEYFDIKQLHDYDLTNSDIQQKQVDIAAEYGLKGFIIYYYWFTENTITNENRIMNKGYDNFFNGSVVFPKGFKVYFSWANEDWSNNPAFNTGHKIINKYDTESFLKNINTLIQYFKHDNYYKINNCPVFYIHHPWHFEHIEMIEFHSLLTSRCVTEGFSGVHIVINNITKRVRDFPFIKNRYNHNPDYKKVPGVVDYEKHLKENMKLTNDEKMMPSSMYFSFNNKARLFIPNRHDVSTTITTSYNGNQYINLDIILSNYFIPRDELNRIFIINSWNEWGENMAVEPSDEKGFTYLNMIKFGIMRFYNMLK